MGPYGPLKKKDVMNKIFLSLISFSLLFSLDAQNLEGNLTTLKKELDALTTELQKEQYLPPDFANLPREIQVEILKKIGEDDFDTLIKTLGRLRATSKEFKKRFGPEKIAKEKWYKDLLKNLLKKILNEVESNDLSEIFIRAIQKVENYKKIKPRYIVLISQGLSNEAIKNLGATPFDLNQRVKKLKAPKVPPGMKVVPQLVELITPFVAIIQSKNKELFDKALQMKPNLNTVVIVDVFKTGSLPLIEAVKTNDLYYVKKLVDAGANVNQIVPSELQIENQSFKLNEPGNSALSQAIKETFVKENKEKRKIIDFLLNQKGIIVGRKDFEHLTNSPLFLAAFNYDFSLLNRLLQKTFYKNEIDKIIDFIEQERDEGANRKKVIRILKQNKNKGV